MTLTLAKRQKQFVDRLVRAGKFGSQAEVVHEALRRLAAARADYLTPPKLTPAQIQSIYGRNDAEASRERRMGRAAFAAIFRCAATSPARCPARGGQRAAS
jgi:putative addiction module CopG family antidote